MTIRTVAVLGANSQIGRDYVESLLEKSDSRLYLFSRNPALLSSEIRLEYKERFQSLGYEDFGFHRYDLVVNFVGASNPQKITAMGHDIFDVTDYYDSLVVAYLKKFSNTQYVFISSGAAYGDAFSLGPVDENTESVFNLNNLMPSQYYGASKYLAEKHHRKLKDLKIIDLRVFSYFSERQDLTASLLISDIVQSIKAGENLKTSDENIFRDYIGRDDFYHLMECITSVSGINTSVDAYSLDPIAKIDMLNHFKNRFGLSFTLIQSQVDEPSTRKYYYSLKRVPLLDMGYTPKLNSLDLLSRVFIELL